MSATPTARTLRRHDRRATAPLHPRPPRSGAALAPLAHGRELGRVPAAAPRRRARRSSTSAAGRARSPSTSRARVAPARVVGIDAAPAAIEAADAERETPGQRPTSSSAPPTCTRSTSPTTPSTSCTRTRCCSTSPDPVGALREMRRVCKPGGIVAARDGDYAAFTWYPADPALDAWLDAVPTPSPAPTTASPTRAASCSRGRTPPASPTCSRARRRGASPRPTTAPGGATSGPTASPSPRSPTQAVEIGVATAEQLARDGRRVAPLGRRSRRLVRRPPRRDPRRA